MVLLPLLAAACLTQQGSVVPKQDYESLISGLTQQSSWLDFREIGDGDPKHRFGPVMKLVDSGFAAIPTLLDHLHDSRLTKAEAPMRQGNEYRNRTVTVSSFCVGILMGYHDGGSDFLSSNTPTGFGKDFAPPFHIDIDMEPGLRAWWEKAKRLSEQDYCYRTVINAEHAPAPILVRLLELHYPYVIPAADEALAVRDPGAYTAGILVIASRMKFSDQTMIRLCLRNAMGTDPESVHVALYELAKVDQARFDDKLTELLDKSTTPLAYVTGPIIAGDLASLVTLTSSSAVWSAFTKAANRAKVEDRAQMVVSIDFHNPPATRRKMVLSFLCGFFGDSSKTKDGMPINDLAASEVGTMLRIEAPGKGASEAKWDAFREKLAAAVAG